MATLASKSGLRILQFPHPDRPGRATLRLGRMDVKSARHVQGHVDRLLIARASGAPVPLDTAHWLGSVDANLHAKLIKHGLTHPREGENTARVELAAFLDSYIAKRTDIKPRTVSNLQQARNSLVTFFGKTRDISTRPINRGEARDWRQKIAERLAPATVAMHVKKARQFFADAMDRHIVTENAFLKLKVGSQKNESRMIYVPAADVLKVIAACPDAEWRLVFALARFAGLRTPSETGLLRWSDIDWSAGRMIVRSPKTEHHEGRDSRELPLFPEVLSYLLDARELADDGAVHVLSRLRGENLRTTAEKIVRRSGVTPWSKLFQNLRSSFETDLTASFPLHVACGWAGNTEAVAVKHYLKITDEHFSQAAAGTGVATRTASPRTAEWGNGQHCSGSPELAVLKSAAKSAADSSGKDRTRTALETQKPRFSGVFASNQYPQGESNPCMQTENLLS